MQEREIACIYYEYEHSCLKGREGTFWEACQICKKYKPRNGGTPARRNFKKQKMAEIREKDIKNIMRDYI
jgi:hypothetical protein